MMKRNKLVPELRVTDLNKSLAFWGTCLGFKVASQRLETALPTLTWTAPR